MKRIGVLTSGGDAPGMNAAIRAVVRGAIDNDIEVYGIMRGYAGLLADDMIPMTRSSVSNIIQRGGTILKTARCEEFTTHEGRLPAIENIKKRGLDGIVVIGGDGSFRGAKALSEAGVPAIGIPGTIDNDIAYTDYTLGFDTACNTVLYCINNLRDTMESHERINIVEVMGRNCGDIALYTGITGGAEAIVLPEDPMSVAEVAEALRRSRARGKRSHIVVLAEGAGKAADFEKELSVLGLDVRSTVVGHIQRGGAPTMTDRMLGSRFGYHAVQLLKEGIGNRVIGIVGNEIRDFDIIEALSKPRVFNSELYHASKVLGM